jgi:hypothetical protein
MIGAKLVRVFDDLAQPIGEVVQFPSVILEQRKLSA